MNSTSLISRFPQELIDKVVAENGDNPITLRSSALVCSSFCRSSQCCLFAHIDLDDAEPAPQERSRRLYAVFLRSPHLCSYVRSLSIGVRRFGSWMSEDPNLVPVFGMLHALTSFALTVTFNYFHWRNLPPELRKEICELCQRSRLVKASFINLREFTVLEEFYALVASPALTDLTLANIALPPVVGEHHKSAHGEVRLNNSTLTFDGPMLGVVMRQLAGRISFSHVRNLSFYWHPEVTPHLENIMDASMGSLQDLSLTMVGERAFAS
jgi:hypothetical protein